MSLELRSHFLDLVFVCVLLRCGRRRCRGFSAAITCHAPANKLANIRVALLGCAQAAASRADGHSESEQPAIEARGGEDDRGG